MNATVNKHLLSGDKFMSDMHLRQLRFTYSAQGPFSKKKQEIQGALMKMNNIKLVFSMIWHMGISKI